MPEPTEDATYRDEADLRGSDLTALDPTAVERAGAIVDAEQAVVLARALGFEIR